MEEENFLGHGFCRDLVKFEEDEEEFRSCCEDEGELEDIEKSVVDEFSVKMFFKGVSMADNGDSGSSGLSGIGVLMERSGDFDVIQVQKKLDFYVEEHVADYLALMDGLSETILNNIRRVFGFTDSKILFDQVTNQETIDNPLVMALRQRVLEQAENLESFVLKLVPNIDMVRTLQLAQVAIGIVSSPSKGDPTVENCSICREEKQSPFMIKLKCSHRFCSHCMKTYVDGKVQSSQVPIRCPQLRCKYFISITECKSFLPVTSYESLERAFAEANVVNSDSLYCPFPNCSALLDPHECLFSKPSSMNQDENSCVECPFCQRCICVECGVPWHYSKSCEEYQSLPLEERDAGDVYLQQLAENEHWRRCQQCRRMIELTHGCNHMTCWCGHEFCYSCGAEYRGTQQTCECTFWDEEYTEDVTPHPAQQFEQWAWDSFGSLSTVPNSYTDQERSQLALVQRFLVEGFSLSDHNTCHSPPRCTDSYVDTMKDIHHQLPWLERFVSVISDNYYDEYIH